MARGSDIKEARIKWVTEHDLVPDEARKAFENAETLTVPAPLPISELAKKAVSKSGLDPAEMLLAIVGGTSPHTLHNLEGELREHYRREYENLVLSAYDQKRHAQELKDALADALQKLEDRTVGAGMTVSDATNQPKGANKMLLVAQAEEAAEAVNGILSQLPVAGLAIDVPWTGPTVIQGMYGEGTRRFVSPLVEAAIKTPATTWKVGTESEIRELQASRGIQSATPGRPAVFDPKGF